MARIPVHDDMSLADIWVHRYSLRPRRRLSAISSGTPREGALIRAGDGVADVHPWPELGDAPLDQQLQLLTRGELTPLTSRSLALAKADGDARRQGRSLFEGLRVPASHWPGDDPPVRFDTVKIKCGPDFTPRDLPRDKRIRLDFNATLTPDQFERIAAELPRERIDFVEDPCPYDESVWQRLRQRTGVRLAIDRGTGAAADVLVVKPAVQEMPPSDGREIVVTSYMDHAVGQVGAAWVAAKNSDRLSSRCGLLTHVLYEDDPFFERLAIDGQCLEAPSGTGIGFDDLLQRLPWKKLS